VVGAPEPFDKMKGEAGTAGEVESVEVARWAERAGDG
jgi:hypothetical protein